MILFTQFTSHDAHSIQRPASGKIDILIGFQYAAYHPVCLESVGHLLLLKNRFGVIIAGSHPNMKERTKKIVQHATILFTSNKADEFFSIESLGVSCTPACGGCRCGQCHPGAKNMSLLDEKELMLIKNGLSFDVQQRCWVAKYPWIKDPSSFPENRYVAFATLKSTENTLMKNLLHADTYKRQIEDMLNREVARKVSEDELKEYSGPKFFISHHDVLRPGSNSTAMRIVFDSSAKVNGISLNSCLAKGPSLLNNLLGILFRFREERFAFIGDISKMFHSIKIPLEDQMMHLFLWRDLNTEQKPSTYAMTAVNMGDRPAAAIAQTALRETAIEAQEKFPASSKIIIKNSYMDDIPASVKDGVTGNKSMKEIESILASRGFKIKGWTFSGQPNSSKTSLDQKAVQKLLNKLNEPDIDKVLGMTWDAENDKVRFPVNQIQEIVGETKRELLSTIYRIWDPLGLLTPLTVSAKIILRKVWAARPQLDWDDPLPYEIQQEWDDFRENLMELEKLSFVRTIKPLRGEDPVLIVFSDGSKNAYGCAAYIRWNTPKALSVTC